MLFFVPPFIPALVQAFPLVYLFCYTCAGTLRKHPLAFYLPWAAVVVFVSWGELFASLGLNSLAFVADYNAWLSSTRDAHPLFDPALYLYPFDGMRLFETFYQGGAAFRSDFAGYVASAWIYAALFVAYPVLRLRRRHKAKPQNLVGKTLHEIGFQQA